MNFFIAFLFYSIFTGNFMQHEIPRMKMRTASFEIAGLIKNAMDSEIVVLNYFGTDRMPDTCLVFREHFLFKIKISEPIFAILSYRHENLPTILEGKGINVNATNNSFSFGKVESGVLNKQLGRLNSLQEPLLVGIDSLSQIEDDMQRASQKNLKVIAATRRQLSKKREHLKQLTLNFIKTHPNSMVGAANLLWWYSLELIAFDRLFFNEAYQSFQSSMKPTLYINRLKKLIELHNIKAGNKVFFDVEGVDANGSKTKLSDLKARYVLIDFWASWCAPCRHENRILRSAYNEFEHGAFDIFSVSIDEKNENWLRGIKEDNLTWTNVREPMTFHNGIDKLKYGFRGIPRNFLLNRERKVVGKDLSGDSLIIILRRLLPSAQ